MKDQALAGLTRLVTVLESVVPPEVEDAHALHETACDVYDIAVRNLDAARQAVTDAAKALTLADEEWSQAGADMDAAARSLAAARKSAGVVLGADGYRPVSL
jgi:hypothetical protein